MIPGTKRTADLYRTVAYRADRIFLVHLPTALFIGLLGLTMLAFSDDADTKHFVAAGALIAACLAWIGFGLYRRGQPSQPVIELSPIGLLLRISHVKQVRIPWREISDVESVSGFSIYPRMFRYRDEPAISVSRSFYDRQIHPNSSVMQGPDRAHTFRVEKDIARITFFTEGLDVSKAELRQAVEARWKAFGSYQSSVEPGTSRPADPAPSGLSDKQSPGLGLASIWYGTKVAGLLAAIVVVLANALGYWQTDGQREARIAHETWQAQLRKWEDEEKQAAEERRKRDKEWDDFWRKNRF